MQFTEDQILAAARVLSDRAAKDCNVNKDDNWDIYCGNYIDDAKAALAVLSAAAPQVVADEFESLVAQFIDIIGVTDTGDTLVDARSAIDKLHKVMAAPVQAQEPVAAAISYWKGPTDSNGTPRECGDANIGRWLEYEPTTLKHGMAIKDRGDQDKRVKFLFDVAPVQRLRAITRNEMNDFYKQLHETMQRQNMLSQAAAIMRKQMRELKGMK